MRVDQTRIAGTFPWRSFKTVDVFKVEDVAQNLRADAACRLDGALRPHATAA
jgi:hypothetical protein